MSNIEDAPAIALPEQSVASEQTPTTPRTRREVFEARLGQEILISERLRVQILAAIPAIALILFLALTSSYPEVAEQAFNSKLDRLRVGLLLGGFAVYELSALRNVERWIASNTEPPIIRRYLNALVEISLPTLAILYYTSVVSPAEALLLPPSLMYFLFILLSTLRLDFKLCLFTGTMAALEYAVLALLSIGREGERALDPVLVSETHHLGKALILLVTGVAAGFVARRLRSGFVRTLESMEERNRVVNVFGQHVSPAVVDRLLTEKTDVRSEVRKVCVMFLDIRNFTSFCERRSPEEVVNYLNSLFGFMIESVNAHHGIVNKFLGDGFMAVFGAPLSDGSSSRHAVEAALEIIARVDELVREGTIPKTRVGMGIAAGEAVIGNVGSAMRKEYTVIGDVVNVASRLEAMNKELGAQILVTAPVWEEAGVSVEEAVEREGMMVRGRKEPIRVVQLA